MLNNQSIDDGKQHVKVTPVFSWKDIGVGAQTTMYIWLHIICPVILLKELRMRRHGGLQVDPISGHSCGEHSLPWGNNHLSSFVFDSLRFLEEIIRPSWSNKEFRQVATFRHIIQVYRYFPGSDCPVLYSGYLQSGKFWIVRSLGATQQ